MLKLSLLTGVLSVAVLAGAAAQDRAPASAAPLAITPPSAEKEWERAERAREELNYQRERDRLDLERRQLLNEDIRESRGDRGLLGAPVFVQPGATPYYAAPQYPGAGVVGPGYTAPYYSPGYGPGSYGPTMPPATTAQPRSCVQTAPAYDEAGRFLANVCVR